MDYEEIVKKLDALKNPRNIAGMARFGIRPESRVLGIPIPMLRKLAKEIGKDHKLALQLFDSNIQEGMILAGYIEDPEKVTEKQFKKWVKTFDSWGVVDQVCSACLDKTKSAKKKIFELSKRKEEFVKRTAFTLIACLSVHNKEMSDKEFMKFFPIIKQASTDDRNFVKKAVNWALRQIGKRNKKLNKEALKLAKEIKKINSKSAKWISSDAIRELTSEGVHQRLKTK